jgi:hypothetical protein
MQAGIESVLRLFLFSEHLLLIAMVCVVIFLGNFFGGLVYSIVIAYTGPRQERPLKERMSFRLSLMSELFLVIYAFYYHAVLIQRIELAQVFFWIFALIISPLLALLGAQITHVIFAKEIEANKNKLRRMEAKKRMASLSAAERAAESVLAQRHPGNRGKATRSR